MDCQWTVIPVTFNGEVIMKKLQIALMALILVALVSCSKTEDDFSDTNAFLKTDQPAVTTLREFEGTLSGWMKDDLYDHSL